MSKSNRPPRPLEIGSPQGNWSDSSSDSESDQAMKTPFSQFYLMDQDSPEGLARTPEERMAFERWRISEEDAAADEYRRGRRETKRAWAEMFPWDSKKRKTTDSPDNDPLPSPQIATTTPAISPLPFPLPFISATPASIASSSKVAPVPSAPSSPRLSPAASTSNPAATSLTASADINVLVLSSDDEEVVILTPKSKIKSKVSPFKPAITQKLSHNTAVKKSVKVKKVIVGQETGKGEEKGTGKGKGKVAKIIPTWTIEDEMQLSDKKLKGRNTKNDFKRPYPTAISYARHLVKFPQSLIPPFPTILKHCRIILVDLHEEREDYFTVLHHVARTGATIIVPEDFVPSPINLSGMNQAVMSKELGWTTHIVVLDNERRPALENDLEFIPAVLSTIGNGKLSALDLGPFVKILSYDWIRRTRETQLVYSEEVPLTWNFELRNDPRNPPEEPTIKKVISEANQSDRLDKNCSDNDEDENDSESGSVISPFGTHDYPPEEAKSPIASTSELELPAGEQEEVNVANLNAETSIVLGDDYCDSEEEEDSDHELTIYRDQESDSSDYDTEDEAAGRPTKDQRLSARQAPKINAGWKCARASDGSAVTAGPNDALANILDALAEIADGKDDIVPFKQMNYRKAANSLRRHPYKITKSKDARLLPGIGKNIASRIPEIIKTGTHRKLLAKPIERAALKLFKGVYGAGAKITSDWYELGARTLEDLESHSSINLTVAQKIGIQYYDDLQQRIPRSEVTELFEWVKKASKLVDSGLIVECMGSYRRGEVDCGDIDILVTRDNTVDGIDHMGMIRTLRETLKTMGVLKIDLAISESEDSLSFKLHGLCKLPGEGHLMRRVDILGVPFDQLPSATIYYTGNSIFNRSLRLKARRMGYSLNQICLSTGVTRNKDGTKSNDGTPVRGITCEEDIFKILRVDWQRPEDRRP